MNFLVTILLFFTILSSSVFGQDDSSFIKGINFVQHGDYNSAIPCFKQDVINNPNSAESYYELGKCYLNIHDFSNAIESFEKCISIDPNCETYEWISTPYILIGDAYISKGDTNKALDYYNKSLSVFPQDDIALSKLKEIKNSLGSTNNKYIDLTKNYPNTTCRPYTNVQCFDLFFDNCTWKYFKSKSGSNIVEFSGSAKQEFLKPGMSLCCLFQYIVNNNKPEIGYLEINNEKQPTEYYDMFLLQTIAPVVIEKNLVKPIPNKIE